MVDHGRTVDVHGDARATMAPIESACFQGFRFIVWQDKPTVKGTKMQFDKVRFVVLGRDEVALAVESVPCRQLRTSIRSTSPGRRCRRDHGQARARARP
jgi:hypothetical protein